MATIQIKRNNSNAATKPSSLLVGELAGNLLDRSLFSSDGSNVFQFYTGTTKWFDTSGNANNANKLGGIAASNYLTGITSAMVTTALGYTPYNSANFTKATIKSTLGIADWALAASKPSYSWSEVTGKPSFATVATSGKYSDLSGVPTSLPASDVYAWAKKATLAVSDVPDLSGKYLSLSGGTIEGHYGALSIKRSSAYPSLVKFENTSGILGYLGFENANTPVMYKSDASTYYTLLHSNNYSSYALPLSGGTLTGRLYIQGEGTAWMTFKSSTQTFGNLGMNETGPKYWDGSTSYSLIHTGNYADTTDKRYLRLSGGTISGKEITPLSINTTATREVGVILRMSNSDKAWLGYTPNVGVHLYSYGDGNGAHKLGVTDAGVGFLDSNTLIHSGNIGSYNAGSATKLQTARTIWGQSFDGTANVSGTLKPSTESFILNDSYDSPYLRLYNGVDTYAYMQLVSNTLHLGSGYSSNKGIYIINNGNVLIGNATDSGDKLRINGAVRAAGHIRLDRYHGASEYLQLEAEDVNINYRAFDTDGWCSHNFYSNDNLLVRIDGYASKLDVNGDIVTTGGITCNHISKYDSNAGYLFGSRNDGLGVTDGGALVYAYGNTPISMYTNGLEVMRVLGNGNVLIGTTTDSGYKLDVNGTSKVRGKAAFGHTILADRYNGQGNTAGAAIIVNKGGNYFGIGASAIKISNLSLGWVSDLEGTWNQELITITEGTNRVGIKTTTPSYALDVNGSLGAGSTTLSSLTVNGDTHIGGNLTATGDGVFGSDARYKSKLQDLAVDIETIANAPVFSYKWIDREDSKVHLGTTAQYWLDTNFRDAVDTSNKDFYHLNYGALGVAIGVSLAKKTVDHEERIKALEKENKELKNELKQLKQWHN